MVLGGQQLKQRNQKENHQPWMTKEEKRVSWPEKRFLENNYWTETKKNSRSWPKITETDQNDREQPKKRTVIDQYDGSQLMERNQIE